MPPNLKKKIEQCLSGWGFTDAPLRAIILWQVILLVFSLLAGVLLAGKTSWFLFFFVGAALFSLNFWSMSYSLLKMLPGQYSSALVWRHFFRFALRIGILAAILAVILWAGASPLALGLGVFSSLAVIGCVGAACLMKGSS